MNSVMYGRAGNEYVFLFRASINLQTIHPLPTLFHSLPSIFLLNCVLKYDCVSILSVAMI